MRRDAAIELARRLYEALATWDTDTLRAILHPELRGEATAGLPLGIGGTFTGRDDMMDRFWRQIGRSYAARAVPDRFALVDDGRLLVQGFYEGRARKGGALHAAFVHLLGFEGDTIRSIEQLTDSKAWADALSRTPDGPRE